MPADKFNYKPSGDQRTFGQLVDHMVETNHLLCGEGAAWRRTVEGTKDADSKEEGDGAQGFRLRFSQSGYGRP